MVTLYYVLAKLLKCNKKAHNYFMKKSILANFKKHDRP